MIAILTKWAEWWPLVAMLGGVLSCGYVAVQLRSGVMGAIALALLASSASYLLAHHRTWNEATAHYAAVVNACMAANAQDTRTIGNLEAANREWAQAAKANAVKVSQAEADVAAMKANDAKKLAESQARLHKIEAQHGDAHAWAVTPVPAGVAGALRADSVRQ